MTRASMGLAHEPSWLREPTIAALREALRGISPELAEGVIVPRWPEPTDDPRWWAASAVIDGSFIAKFAWSASAARRITRETRVLEVLGEVAPQLPLPDIVAFSHAPAVLVLHRVPAVPFFALRGRIGPAQRDRVARDLGALLAVLHDPDVLRSMTERTELPARPAEPATTGALRGRLGDVIRPDQRGRIHDWCDWVDGVLSGEGRRALVHGDLHGNNHLWNPRTGRLHLVVDLETVGVGEPEFDMRCLPGDCGVRLFLDVLTHYRALRHVTVDTDRIMAWHVRAVLDDVLWRTEAGVPLPDHGEPARWVDELHARLVEIETAGT